MNQSHQTTPFAGALKDHYAVISATNALLPILIRLQELKAQENRICARYQSIVAFENSAQASAAAELDRILKGNTRLSDSHERLSLSGDIGRLRRDIETLLFAVSRQQTKVRQAGSAALADRFKAPDFVLAAARVYEAAAALVQAQEAADEVVQLASQQGWGCGSSFMWLNAPKVASRTSLEAWRHLAESQCGHRLPVVA